VSTNGGRKRSGGSGSCRCTQGISSGRKGRIPASCAQGARLAAAQQGCCSKAAAQRCQAEWSGQLPMAGARACGMWQLTRLAAGAQAETGAGLQCSKHASGHMGQARKRDGVGAVHAPGAAVGLAVAMPCAAHPRCNDVGRPAYVAGEGAGEARVGAVAGKAAAESWRRTGQEAG